MLHDEVPVRRCLMHYNPLTMISTESLSQEWLETVSRELGYPNKGLLEKRSKRPDPGREEAHQRLVLTRRTGNTRQIRKIQ